MGQYVPEINLASIISARRDQSNLVAANVEDSESSHLIRVRKSIAQLREVRKASFPHDRIPMRERGFGVRMLSGEFIQALSCDDMHSYQEVTDGLLDRKAHSKKAENSETLIGLSCITA